MSAIEMETQLFLTWSSLPLDKRQETLDFANFLKSQDAGPRSALRSAFGICAHLNSNISAEEIDEARREMWGSFPRDDS